MEQNKELSQAWDFVEHTGRSIFLTGKAGTGKTTFLKHVVEHSAKRIIVVAPTGVAAINANGVTIHSFFQLPLTPFLPDAKFSSKYNFSNIKRKIIRSLDLLIIDEISMVRSDLLDAIDQVLRRFRGSGRPFGGVQLLMIGDLQQLTPVVTPEEEKLLGSYYDTPYFFGSKALGKIDYVTIELKHIYRQQDTEFIRILNNIREGKATADDMAALNKCYKPTFRPSPDEGYIRLTTHNNRADGYNKTELEKLESRAFRYEAVIEGIFPETAYPTNVVLDLKKDAQVMFIKNDYSAEHRYYNGRIGRVVSIDSESVRVMCQGDERPIDVEPVTWENTTYNLNSETKEIESRVQGTFRQLPLRLAWAITIHKSQGLTFDKAIVEVDASFASGQVYVALSRCRSMEGLVLASPIMLRNIINDSRVTDYITNQETAAKRSISALPVLKEEYYRSQLVELFTFSDILRFEKSLTRQLEEFFSNSYPRLTQAHVKAVDSINKEVIDVARKWTALIAAKTTTEIHGDEFLDRVKRGCKFFSKQLTDILEKPLKRCLDVKTGNKEAKKRLANAYTDMMVAYLGKISLLNCMAKRSFSTQRYLKYKQTAVVFAMEGKKVDVKSEKTDDKSGK